MDSETVIPMQFKPFNWLKDAKIYNKKGDEIPTQWLVENADVIVLLFSAKGIDKDGIIHKFYTIYENIKVANVPVEVIYIPFDEIEKEYIESYEEQANWFTLRFNDPLVFILKYLYEITCLPFVIVIKPDCSVISSHGLSDIETYGKNAIVTWLTTPCFAKDRRRVSQNAQMYGVHWNYASANEDKKFMQRKFSGSSGVTSTSTCKK